MYLNDMATVLRAAGCVVEEAPSWIGHNHGQLAQVDSIIIHHTAGSSVGDYPSFGVVRNGRADLAGPLANLGVGRSGKVYTFSNGVAYHAGTVKASWMDNTHSIGIEVESVGTGPAWPDVQVHGTARAVAALCKKYSVPVSRVLGHKEVCYPVGRKVDPVGIPGDMVAFRALVQRYINGEFNAPVKKNYPEEFMYIKCEGKGTALLTGNIFVGLGSPGELSSANAAIAAGAPVQWVEPYTWNDLDSRSKALTNWNATGLPVRVVGEANVNVTNDSVNVVDVTPSA